MVLTPEEAPAQMHFMLLLFFFFEAVKNLQHALIYRKENNTYSVIAVSTVSPRGTNWKQPDSEVHLKAGADAGLNGNVRPDATPQPSVAVCL